MNNINKISNKTLAAIIIGNALEWYDFVVYSFLTVFIAKLFFPTTHATTALLSATATVGVAFFMRPLGGIVLGAYADRCGRKAAMMIIISIMTVATMMMVFAPTFAQAGMFATAMIVIARLLQGFSAGGEFGTSTAMLIELSPAQQRGFYASWQMSGQMCALLIGALLGMLLTNFLTTAQMETWGWRVPFILGLLIAPLGMYLRLHVNDMPLLRDAQHSSQKKIISAIKQKVQRQFSDILIAMGILVGATAASYINIAYMPTYVTRHLNLSMQEAFAALVISLLGMLVIIPLFGALSDRIGRKRILITAITLYLLSIYPLFAWLTAAPSLSKLIFTQFISCALLAMYVSVLPAMMAELFPRHVRSLGLSISHNFCVMLFGGFAQFIVTWLINLTATSFAMIYYLLATSAISLLTAIFYREKKVIEMQLADELEAAA